MWWLSLRLGSWVGSIPAESATDPLGIGRKRETVNKYEEIRDAARLRGLARGIGDCEQGYQNDAPLSGEWAGESIPELLGDLIDAAERYAGDSADIGEIQSELCDSYEEGYRDAFSDRESAETV